MNLCSMLQCNILYLFETEIVDQFGEDIIYEAVLLSKAVIFLTCVHTNFGRAMLDFCIVFSHCHDQHLATICVLFLKMALACVKSHNT